MQEEFDSLYNMMEQLSSEFLSYPATCTYYQMVNKSQIFRQTHQLPTSFSPLLLFSPDIYPDDLKADTMLLWRNTQLELDRDKRLIIHSQ